MTRQAGGFARLIVLVLCLMSGAMHAAVGQGHTVTDPFMDPALPGWRSVVELYRAHASRTVTGGALRLRASASEEFSGRTAIARTDLHARDFLLRMDILDWDREGTGTSAGISLMARLSLDPLQYILCTFAPRSARDPSKGMLLIHGQNTALKDGVFDGEETMVLFDVDPEQAYRLEFSGRGDEFQGRLFARDDPFRAVASITVSSSMFPEGGAMGILGEAPWVEAPDEFLQPWVEQPDMDFTVTNFAATSGPDLPGWTLRPAVRISWDASFEGAVLESAPDVTGPWTRVEAGAQVWNGRRLTWVEAGSAGAFYRLVRP